MSWSSEPERSSQRAGLPVILKIKEEAEFQKGFTAHKNKGANAHAHRMQTKSPLIGLGRLFSGRLTDRGGLVLR